MTILRQAVAFSGLVIQLGLVIVVAIYLGFRLGGWLDALTGQRMIFSGLGAVLGIASGFAAAYRMIMSMIRQQESGVQDHGDQIDQCGDDK